MSNNDAVDEDELILCCAVCCANCSILTNLSGCMSCSGKVGLCCLNMEVCCKPGAPKLPCLCCGPKCEYDGCSCVNTQLQLCCCVCSAAFPCNQEVPVAISACGITVFPECGCCIKQKVSYEKRNTFEKNDEGIDSEYIIICIIYSQLYILFGFFNYYSKL